MPAVLEEESDSSDEEVSELAIVSPKKQAFRADLNPSSNIPESLPDHLLPRFNACRRAILKSLQCPSLVLPAAAEDSVNGIAVKQLVELIDGTVLRAEGNSCLVLGPRGSGKSQMVDACLEKVAAQNPIILRLSGWVQNTDRHALREIAFQLLQQTGTSLLPDSEKVQLDDASEAEEDENPFLDSPDHLAEGPTLSLPPSSHLHALIPVLLTLSRPVVVILDAFDLFALHPRQSLLYCLLDTVQNCRASSESRGIAVIGITSRVDTVQLLEKRVKSRFSGRTIRTAPPADLETCLTMVRTILLPSNMDGCGEGEGEEEEEEEWNNLWTASVERFLAAKDVTNVFNETFTITRDFKVVARILTACIIRIKPSQPYLSFQDVSACTDLQRSRLRTTYLNKLSYPALCLLIASAHTDTAGHKSFTFEMLYDTFRNQVRALASAPVQVNGGNIGMMRCTREAFEELISANIYMCVAAPSSNIAKQFTKYRCVIDQPDVKAIIDKAGNTNLKKWLTKNQ
ncbi:hypothetical protein HYPSUDRAFT_126194 [Hypholoma sublateritium FD-334 SS-4]|uniref:Uncharacterized protein n=1 Tax=Hypholoma sublateritium (strain FD-334 SS-4) TaxID=945553 RepID=A0A0D2PNV5_HYPSF|nr:hypothetical protein HYPSUDRAFT_126194 [Hypholoma sublateritium FD-334 SS-4]